MNGKDELVIVTSKGPGVFFTDGAGTIWTLDHEPYAEGGLGMSRRTRALALALLDVARQNVEGDSPRSDANADSPSGGAA